MATILTLLALVNVAGAPYYRLSVAERVRSPLHAWLRPSGVVGQSAGILALAIFVFLWLYPLRKKYRSLAFTGSIARWLDVHILAAIGLPLLIAVHASWRFDGVVGLGYFAMLVVWASGVVGRYLYVRIPQAGLASPLRAMKWPSRDVRSSPTSPRPLVSTRLSWSARCR